MVRGRKSDRDPSKRNKEGTDETEEEYRMSKQLKQRFFGPRVVGFALLLCVGVSAAPASAGVTISGNVTAKKMRIVKNSVVYLKKVPGTHKPSETPVRIDQINQTFKPGVLPIVVGTTVDFLNNDNTVHNVFSPDGEEYDLGNWGYGEKREYTFKKRGVYAQLCKLHPAMLAYVVVLQNPYFAMTKGDGSFEIPDVPPGKYKLAVWNQRRKGKAISVEVADAPVSDLKIKLGK
jgi:plastocyanin